MIKKTIARLTAAAAAMAFFPVYMAAPGRATKKKKAPFMNRNFAHRGLHTPERDIPENSLPAFDLAASEGYGIELDVQLSRDGQVVVFHDDTLNRVCGVEGRVDEYDYSQLAAMKLCGSEYGIPLFTEVLKTVDGRGPLIVELKTGKRNKELCRKTCDLLRSYHGEACIESFDPTIVAWFRFHGREFLRGQLATRPEKYDAASYKYLRYLLGNTLFNFMARPQFIAYETVERTLPVKLAGWMGAMKVCWTSHERANEEGNDAVIFEFYRPPQVFR